MLFAHFRRYRSLGGALRADAGRAIAMAAGGAAVFAPIEYALTLWAYPGSIPLASDVRLVALVATLSIYLFFMLAVAASLVVLGHRLIGSRISPVRGTGPGLFAQGPLEAGVRPGAPKVWAAATTGLAVVIVVQRAGVYALLHFKEPQLTAGLVAVVALAATGLASPVYRVLALATRAGADAIAAVLPGRLQVLNPLGRWRACGLALAGLAGGALAAAWFLVPPARSVMPVRLVISALVIAFGMGLGAHLHAIAPRSALTPSHRRARARFLAALSGVLVGSTLLFWGADLGTKYVAITASPALDKLIHVVRISNDVDLDGYGSLLGEGDCRPFTASIHPGARDTPSNDIDENCDGRDFSLADITPPPGPSLPVPPQFTRDWNILLLTIDTVRYDRTTFGGWDQGPKQRDTTPNLAAYIKDATNFTFAQAPSAGTMASIPAILTSKFFHSGIALDEHRPPGTPPGITEENTLLPEIVKRAGYHTGVIGSHAWWNGWGLEQGVDDYDNSIAKTDDPRRVAADKVTDHALAWIARNQGKKWFMWAHYIDPHGYYIGHPEIADWGNADADLYESELKWTDQQVGRLLDELRRLPSYDNTVVIITSDHGESMGEHNVPLGTHGSALYNELLHVPLIIYVPNNKPRSIQGAVSGLDIVPTVAELVRADVSDLSFEGRSLVPQIFYGREDLARVVFAETNAGGKQRAAITERWRLIYYLASNVYELFDQHADPKELTNLAPRNPPELAEMKRALETWMERVLYAKDPVFNQAYRQMADVLVQTPAPEVLTPGTSLVDGKITVLGTSLLDGHIAVLGIGPAAQKPLVAGAKSELHVYFEVTAPTPASYRFQVAVWPQDTAVEGATIPPTAIRSAVHATADGAYPTERWKAGDHIRERFALVIPPTWTGSVQVALIATSAIGAQTLVLGALPLGSSPAPAP